MNDRVSVPDVPLSISHSTDAQGRRVAHITEEPPKKGKASGGAPAREGARKSADFKAVSTAPSINKTPVGNSTPPLPYATFQDLSNSQAVVPNVTFNGDPVYVLDQTLQPSCQGDSPGTATGVKSSTVNGYVKPTGASSTVTIGGKQAVRFGDPCVMNGGNNPGIYVTDAPASANPAKSAAETSNPPRTLETAQEKSWFERGRDYLKEKLTPAAEQPVEAAKGAAKGVANTPSHLADMIGQGNMLQQAADLDQQAALQSAFGLDKAAQSTSEAAQAIREAASHVDTPKFEMSNKAQESGDFIATAIQLLTGAAGVVKGVGKGIPALLKEVRTAETVAADAAKAQQVAADGAKAAQAADAAKAGQAGQGAAKKAESPGDGVVVKPKEKPKLQRKPRQPRTYEKKVVNEDGSVTYTLKDKEGKLFDLTYKDGYPDFSPYQYKGTLGKAEVPIEMTGDNATDFARANKAAGFGDNAYSHPDGYTWHHNQDGQTMQLVESGPHAAAPHTGGASFARGGQ